MNVAESEVVALATDDSVPLVEIELNGEITETSTYVVSVEDGGPKCNGVTTNSRCFAQ